MINKVSKIEKPNTNISKCINIEREYVLFRNKINWGNIDRWGKLHTSKNFSILFFTTIPENYLKKYATVLEEIENSMPTEIEEPYFKISADDLISEEKKFEPESRNEKILSCIAIDENEDIIGLNRNFIKNMNLSYMRQWQFGIIKEYQGKGIAKWLKALVYKKLFTEYSELQSIGSDTHPENKRMISIMEGLGFDYLHTNYEYED